MNYPYMPKSTALWLIENTALSFEQIADFCGMHELEVKNIADAETYKIQGLNPILDGQVTREDIVRCEADPDARLTLRENIVAAQKAQNKKGIGYTPKLHRQNRLGGILWILQNYPELSDGQIARLMRSTNPTVASVRTAPLYWVWFLNPHCMTRWPRRKNKTLHIHLLIQQRFFDGEKTG